MFTALTNSEKWLCHTHSCGQSRSAITFGSPQTGSGNPSMIFLVRCRMIRQGGYILYGYGPSGFDVSFSRTLPVELAEKKCDEPNKPK